jgi:hypothetical protein
VPTVVYTSAVVIAFRATAAPGTHVAVVAVLLTTTHDPEAPWKVMVVPTTGAPPAPVNVITVLAVLFAAAVFVVTSAD